MAHHLYLLIGGNQGDRHALLQQATDLIRLRIGSVLATSHLYQTDPWGQFQPGDEPQPFLNRALLVGTELSPFEALDQALAIESDLGRQRPNSELLTPHSSLYSSRPIDIDLIFYDSLVVDNPPRLLLPHPRMHLRRFVLQPLCDIAPAYIHPQFNKTLQQLLTECPDTSCCSCCS